MTESELALLQSPEMISAEIKRIESNISVMEDARKLVVAPYDRKLEELRAEAQSLRRVLRHGQGE